MKKIIFTDEEIEDIKYMYKYNYNLHEIAKKYNVSWKPIQPITKTLTRCFKDKNWLYEQYYINKLNRREIAKLARCSYMTIQNNMTQLGFKVDADVSRKRKYTYNYTFFDSIDTQEKSYWLGFLVADGGISCVGNGGRLTIKLSIVDKYHLEKLKNLLCPEKTITEKDEYLAITNKFYPICYVAFHSKKLVDSLINLKMLPNKSKNEIFPPINKEFYKSFILGNFDGDGCISYGCNKKNKKWNQVFFLGSYEFLYKIESIISDELSIHGKITPKKNIFQLTYTKIEDIFVLMDWLYKDSPIYLERKFNKYKEYLSFRKDEERWANIEKNKDLQGALVSIDDAQRAALEAAMKGE